MLEKMLSKIPTNHRSDMDIMRDVLGKTEFITFARGMVVFLAIRAKKTGDPSIMEEAIRYEKVYLHLTRGDPLPAALPPYVEIPIPTHQAREPWLPEEDEVLDLLHEGLGLSSYLLAAYILKRTPDSVRIRFQKRRAARRQK